MTNLSPTWHYTLSLSLSLSVFGFKKVMFVFVFMVWLEPGPCTPKPTTLKQTRRKHKTTALWHLNCSHSFRGTYLNTMRNMMPILCIWVGAFPMVYGTRRDDPTFFIAWSGLMDPLGGRYFDFQSCFFSIFLTAVKSWIKDHYRA